MNKVLMIGNLTADPEVRKTQNGDSVCTFHIAVQRRVANKQGVREADFFPVVAWRQLADLCGKYLEKGRKIAVEGCMQNRTYQTQDGNKRTVTEIIADEIEFLRTGSESKAPETHAAQEPQPQEMTPADDDDDLPF